MRNVFDTILTPFLWPKTTAKSFKMPLLTTYYYSTLQSTANYHSTLTVIAGNMIYNETTQTQIVCRDFDDKKQKNQGKNRVDSWEDTLSDMQKSVIKRRYGEAQISRHYASDNQAQNHKHTHDNHYLFIPKVFLRPAPCLVLTK